LKYIYSTLVSLFLIGCGSTSLIYQNDFITIQGPDLIQTFKGKTLYTDQINLAQISVQQKVFHAEQNKMLVYEYARLGTGYKFKYDYPYILGHIFDAKSVEMLKNSNGLGFFTLSLKDGSPVYALVKTGTKKSLTMLYGFDEDEFKALMNNKRLIQQDLLVSTAKDHIKSHWDMKLLITGVLLEKEGGKAFYR